MPEFSKQSLEMLQHADKDLQLILNEAIKYIDFKILCTYRGKEEQEEAFAEGKSKLHFPFSNHNIKPSVAVDIAPYFVDLPHIDWKDLLAFAVVYGVIKTIAIQKGISIRWGGDWDQDGRTKDETFMDLPHIELIK